MSKPLYVNRVPTDPIMIEVEQYLAAQENLNYSNKDFLTPRAVLAEQAHIRIDTFEKLLARRSETMDFDLADKLLCLIDKTHYWWAKFGDIYWNVVLEEGANGRKPSRYGKWKVCARPGCANEFIPKKHSPKTGPKAQKYCSRACKHRASDLRLGISKHATAKAHGKMPYHCRKGHPRGPGNSKKRKDGTVVCLVCERERSAKRRQERRDAA